MTGGGEVCGGDSFTPEPPVPSGKGQGKATPTGREKRSSRTLSFFAPFMITFAHTDERRRCRSRRGGVRVRPVCHTMRESFVYDDGAEYRPGGEAA